MILTFLINLFAFVTCFFFGRFLGRQISLLMSITSTIVSFLVSLYYCKYIIKGSVILCNLGEWMVVGNLKINFSFIFDPLSSVFAVLITFITSLILIYSYSYFSEDPNVIKFFGVLNFFCFSMLILVTANNYVVMFLGWEAVGLASYLLINFWHTRNLANKGAIKAILFNRVGDIFFMISLAIIFLLFRSFDLSIIHCLVPLVILKKIMILGVSVSLIDLLAFFLTLAAMAKSAQLFLHPWLPDAMEGPTPVSALLHSATMVTAGLFLILRSSMIFSFSADVSKFISIIGLLTIFISSIPGLYQNDIKRIIAYSTCSQLGFMFLSLGLNNYDATLYHLFNHAFFKALLFLCAGSVIHAINDQDIRRMGGLHKMLPLTYICMLLASLALIGFPSFSGFDSKDLLLENVFSVFHNYSYGVYLLAAISAALTSFYSFRLVYLVFFDIPTYNKQTMKTIGEGTFALYFPMILLTILSMTSGFLLNSLFVSYSHFWGSTLVIMPFHGEGDIEEIPFFVTMLSNIATFLGFFFLLLFYVISPKTKEYINKKFHIVFSLFSKKLMFDSFYNLYLHIPFIKSFLAFYYNIIDKGLLEKFGPFGIYTAFKTLSDFSVKIHSNFIYHMLLFMSFAIQVSFLFFYLPSYIFIILYVYMIFLYTYAKEL